MGVISKAINIITEYLLLEDNERVYLILSQDAVDELINNRGFKFEYVGGNLSLYGIREKNIYITYKVISDVSLFGTNLFSEKIIDLRKNKNPKLNERPVKFNGCFSQNNSRRCTTFDGNRNTNDSGDVRRKRRRSLF